MRHERFFEGSDSRPQQAAFDSRLAPERYYIAYLTTVSSLIFRRLRARQARARFVRERKLASSVVILTRSIRLSGEKLVKTITLLGACAVVAFSLGTAAAGPCTAEIENVTKLLASRDAGS